MSARGRTSKWVAGLIATAALGSIPVSVAASEPSAAEDAPRSPSGEPSPQGLVLVTPVQGSETLRTQLGARLESAVRIALQARGYQVPVSQEALGKAVIACQTPECTEDVLLAADAAFAIVPAIWSRASGGRELTLTLVQRSTRNFNATGSVGANPSQAVAILLDELLAEGTTPPEETVTGAPPSPVQEPAHTHAWKAGPILLIAAGAAAFITIGVAAGVKSDSEQLNTGAVAAWSAIGAAAIAGGVAWWVVGAKRRRRKADSTAGFAPAIAVRPTGIDLRLRF